MSPGDREHFWVRVLALVENLDTLSYYHLLSVDRSATTESIERAYYRRVRTVHPDTHTDERDPQRQHALMRLYARLGEAFRVLRSQDLRSVYDVELAAGHTRLSRQAEQDHRANRAAPDPKTQHARKLHERGCSLVASGQIQAGLAQLELAAKFEPDSKVIQAALASGQRELNAESDESNEPH